MSQADPLTSSPAVSSPADLPGFRKLLGFAHTLGASLGAFGCFALQGILLARILGPADRGVFAVAVLFPQALLYLGLLGAPELFAGYAVDGHPNARLRRSAARYGLVAGCISMTVCILLDWWTIPDSMRHVLPLAILCACTMPLQQIRLSVQAVDHGQRNFTRYNRIRLMAAAAFPVFLLVGYLPLRADLPILADSSSKLTCVCLMFLISQLAAFALIQFGMTDSWRGPGAVPVGKALYEARGLMGAWLSTELLERLDLVLVMVMIANEETMGFYAAAVPMASLMIIVPNAAGLYAFNRGARQEERLTMADIWRFAAVGVGVQVLCASVLAAALPWLVPWFYGEDFAATVNFAWWLLPAGIFRGLLQAADSYLRARKKPALGVKARAIGIPILLGISICGAPALGSAAIPVGLAVAQFVCFCIVLAGILEDAKNTQGAD